MAVPRGSSGETEVEDVLQRAQPRLRRVLGHYRIPAADADDLLQDAVLHFLRHRASIHAPEAWLAGAVVKRCQSYWRARRRQLAREVDATLLDQLPGSTEPDQRRIELRRDLSRLLATVSARCRSFLRLRYRLGCDANEIAQQTGYRPSGMPKLLQRCVAALAHGMMQVGGDGGRKHVG